MGTPNTVSHHLRTTEVHNGESATTAIPHLSEIGEAETYHLLGMEAMDHLEDHLSDLATMQVSTLEVEDMVMEAVAAAEEEAMVDHHPIL